LLPASSLRSGHDVTMTRLGRSLTVRRDAEGALSATVAGGSTLPVLEANDLVFAWHGPGAPTFTIHPLPALSSPCWTTVRWKKLRPVRTSVVNVMRDVVDNAHFGPVHGVREADTRAFQEGHHLRTRTQGIIDTSRFGGPPLHGHLLLEGRVHGLGLLTYEGLLTLGVQIPHVVLSAVAPIDEAHVEVWIGIAVKKVPLPGASSFLRGTFLRGLEEDCLADARFWESADGRSTSAPHDAAGAELLALFDTWLTRFPQVPAASGTGASTALAA
jgi:hypothetical protein